ncbi:hypothetical protein [Bradyrhizobium sp. AUGA SZCCT0431]|uniref:hypothetical protein n=1 Tax=Bradyrhizobium sp. AUGA SZCCT0431 TaxID=2807674 RepID=UPI001BAC4414|nr:hypothetical protein [Bradyrhizobium sp. AUGA SZCCT0431]MBR1146675.1 hypothetical protein [Bradyrhizobium sp. AUGA SZCCT0431]
MNEFELLTEQVQRLERLINQLVGPDRYKLFMDVELGTDRGTKIGTKTIQKLGFYGKTPVVRQSAVTAPSGGGTSDTDAIDISARVAIGQIKTALTNLGLTA